MVKVCEGNILGRAPSGSMNQQNEQSIAVNLQFTDVLCCVRQYKEIFTVAILQP